jgi:hypothetical protein
MAKQEKQNATKPNKTQQEHNRTQQNATAKRAYNNQLEPVYYLELSSKTKCKQNVTVNERTADSLAAKRPPHSRTTIAPTEPPDLILMFTSPNTRQKLGSSLSTLELEWRCEDADHERIPKGMRTCTKEPDQDESLAPRQFNRRS